MSPQLMLGVASLLFLVLSTVIGVGIRWILAGQADIKGDASRVFDGHDTRIDRLEQKSVNFMSRNEIEAAIAAEARNRQTAEGYLKGLAERNETAITDIRVVVGKLESKHESLTGTVVEIKQLLKEQRVETNEKLDSISKCLGEIGRKVQ